MVNQNITVDISSLNRIASGLNNFEKEMPGAVASSLNRTVDFMNTRVGKLVTNEYAIKVGDVKKTIKKIKASKGTMEAGIKSTGGTLSFSHFKFTPNDPLLAKMLSIRYNTLIKVKIKKKGGPKVVKTSPSAFIQSVKGNVNVWKRKGTKRNPIQPLRTLSVPQMIQNVNVGNVIQEEASKKLEERVLHEIEYRLKKVGGK